MPQNGTQQKQVTWKAKKPSRLSILVCSTLLFVYMLPKLMSVLTTCDKFRSFVALIPIGAKGVTPLKDSYDDHQSRKQDISCSHDSNIQQLGLKKKINLNMTP